MTSMGKRMWKNGHSRFLVWQSTWASCVGDLIKHGSGKCQLLGGIYLRKGEFRAKVGVEKGEQEGAHLYL